MSKKLNYAKKYTLTNVIKNGSFENGWADWFPTNSTAIVDGGKFGLKSARLNIDLTNANGGTSQILNLANVTNHKFYMSLYIKNTAVDTGAFYCPFAQQHALVFWLSGAGATAGAWTRISEVQTAIADITKGIFLYSFNACSDFDGMMLMDLSVFGDNPPTKTWLDNNISYFDGSTNVWLIDNEYYTDEQYKNIFNREVAYV